MTAKVAAIDYETYWDDEFSVSVMSYWHYTHDPRFDAYLVSIVTNTGIRWVGHPKDAPWEEIKDHVWVAHNAPFDKRVHERLQELGVVPGWLPPYWGNTANLAAWLRVGRSLKDAVLALFNEKLDKSIRDVETKGIRWENFNEDLRKRFLEYNLADGDWTLKIWTEFIHLWPDRERRIADLYDARSILGLRADVEGLKADIDILSTVMFEAEKKIPWKGQLDDDGKEVKLLSFKAVCTECRNRGIEPPPSMDMKDEGLEKWEEQYGDQHTFIAAIRDWRRANTLREKYRTILDRVRPTDSRFETALAYFGAHTGRSTGKNKNEERKTKNANMLNMARDPMFIKEDWTIAHKKAEVAALAKAYSKKQPLSGIKTTVYLRGRIIPGEGKKFIIADLSQIEPRTTLWFAQDKEFLDMIRGGLSVYDAHAKGTMGYVPEPGTKLKSVNPGMYSTAKMRIISLYYQTSHISFIEAARMMLPEEDFTLVFDHDYTAQDVAKYKEYLKFTRQNNLIISFDAAPETVKRYRIKSWKVVQDFRRKNPKVCRKGGLWEKFQKDLESSIGGNYVITLPNGRKLTYFNVEKHGREISAQNIINGPRVNLYGGKLLENAVQSFDREIFVDIQLRLLDAGYWTCLDVYDEVVLEVDQSVKVEDVVPLIVKNPDYAKSLPLACEAEEAMHYKK